MTHVYSGGCQCGAVRFQVEDPLLSPLLCHCRSCQKAHGAPAVMWVTVPLAKLHFTRGKLKEFQSSPKASRGFCDNCGTPVTWLGTHGQEIDLAVATLDQPDIVAPLRQDGVEARMPWFTEAASLPEESMEPLETTYQHPDHDTSDWPIREEPK